jgi:hypothetical protein
VPWAFQAYCSRRDSDDEFVLAVAMRKPDDWPYPHSMEALIAGRAGRAATYVYHTLVDDDLWGFQGELFVPREPGEELADRERRAVRIDVEEGFRRVEILTREGGDGIRVGFTAFRRSGSFEVPATTLWVATPRGSIWTWSSCRSAFRRILTSLRLWRGASSGRARGYCFATLS